MQINFVIKTEFDPKLDFENKIFKQDCGRIFRATLYLPALMKLCIMHLYKN